MIYNENVLILQQVNNQEEAKIVVPIEYKNEKFFNEEDLSKDCKVILNNERVTVIDFDGTAVQLPSIHRKAEYIKVKLGLYCRMTCMYPIKEV